MVMRQKDYPSNDFVALYPALYAPSVWNEIISNCVELASSNAQDAKRQLEFAGVTYIEGFASFPDSGGTDSLSVSLLDNSIQSVKADKYLLATGSKPFRPGGVPFDGKRIFDSDSINQVSGKTSGSRCLSPYETSSQHTRYP
jgi:pyruvate/2-oxoglutarate dehydrogenase complex dihydrolipoamide dehydrogenase (E3) component